MQLLCMKVTLITTNYEDKSQRQLIQKKKKDGRHIGTEEKRSRLHDINQTRELDLLEPFPSLQTHISSHSKANAYQEAWTRDSCPFLTVLTLARAQANCKCKLSDFLQQSTMKKEKKSLSSAWVLTICRIVLSRRDDAAVYVRQHWVGMCSHGCVL